MSINIVVAWTIAGLFVGSVFGIIVGSYAAVNTAVNANAGHYEVDQKTGDTRFIWGCTDE